MRSTIGTGIETLTASAGATTVFTLTLNENQSGAYTFTLLSHVDNPPGLGETAADDLPIAPWVGDPGDGFRRRQRHRDGHADDLGGRRRSGCDQCGADRLGRRGRLAARYRGWRRRHRFADDRIGNVSTLFLSGADAPLHYSFTASTASLTAESLTSGGVALTYAVDRCGTGIETLTASAGATTVFTLTLNETVIGRLHLHAAEPCRQLAGPRRDRSRQSADRALGR